MALLGFPYLVDRWGKEGGLHMEGFNMPGLEVEQSTSACPRSTGQNSNVATPNCRGGWGEESVCPGEKEQVLVRQSLPCLA